jgi:glycosyltransferase involved in cell wall biosynthesis
MNEKVNMPSPTFSIIIASYNYAHFLARAIDSALAQTYKNHEIIVVDDGSTDNTSEVVKPYLNRIQYHYQENMGHCAANNKGISLASGKYCYFLDADDEMLEDALARFEQSIQEHGEVPLFFGGYISVKENGEETVNIGTSIDSTPYAALKAYLSKKVTGIQHGSVVVHRTVFDQLTYPEGVKNNTDIAFLGQVLSRYQAIGIKTPVVKIHAHPDRVRSNSKLIVSVGLSVVDSLFDPERMPPELMPLKELYRRRRMLSIFRVLYKAGDYEGCRCYYMQAVKGSPALLLELRYLRKYCLSFFQKT